MRRLSLALDLSLSECLLLVRNQTHEARAQRHETRQPDARFSVFLRPAPQRGGGSEVLSATTALRKRGCLCRRNHQSTSRTRSDESDIYCCLDAPHARSETQAFEAHRRLSTRRVEDKYWANSPDNHRNRSPDPRTLQIAAHWRPLKDVRGRGVVQVAARADLANRSERAPGRAQRSSARSQVAPKPDVRHHGHPSKTDGYR